MPGIHFRSATAQYEGNHDDPSTRWEITDVARRAASNSGALLHPTFGHQHPEASGYPCAPWRSAA
jgi:hypothetical protein